MSKNDFFYIGRGCSRDHLGPHKTQKWPEKGPKMSQKRTKIGPGRRHLGRRPIPIKRIPHIGYGEKKAPMKLKHAGRDGGGRDGGGRARLF